MNSMPALGVEIKYKIIYYTNMLKVLGNYRVLSYDDNMIILKCGKDNICISGEKISIAMLGISEIHISGRISGISFE